MIHDRDVLWLCERVLQSGRGVLSDQYDMVFFPGDDLFAVNRPRGLPIGNLTSQFWSNCTLDGFVKRELRCRAYLRYVDDIALFADDRDQLRRWKREIVERLAGLRLTLHEESAQVQPVENGIPWLGFVVYPTHRRLKRRNVVKCRRRLAALVEEHRAGNAPIAKLSAACGRG